MRKLKLSVDRIVQLGLAAALILVLFLFLLTSAELKKVRAELSETNLQNWGSICRITHNAESDIHDLKDIKGYPRAGYDNAIVYEISDRLIPGFNSTEFGFLRMSYDPLMQSLARDEIPEKYKQEGLDLFLQMNHDIEAVCETVVNGNNDAAFKLNLIDQSSPVYKKIHSEIEEVCNKYSKKVEDFYETIN